MISRIRERALSVLFPESIYCIGCGALIDGTRPYSLCDTCRAKFHFATGKTCAKCGRVLAEDYAHNLCNNCMDCEDSHFFERGFTCMMYGLYEKEMLKDFKYHNRPYYARALGSMMYDRIEPEGLGADLVVPVPLHRKKLRERGYNQAELLAREVALRMELPMVRALMRTRYTKPMSKVSGMERSANLMDEGQRYISESGAGSEKENSSVFRVNPLYASVLNGQRILLIDDIYTTGATADACSRALIDAGCDSVFVLTVASAGNPPPQGRE